MTGLPATSPANTTTPASAASTSCPGTAARSTPRCPAPYGVSGASKYFVTTGTGDNGQDSRGCRTTRVPAGQGSATPGSAAVGGGGQVGAIPSSTADGAAAALPSGQDVAVQPGGQAAAAG